MMRILLFLLLAAVGAAWADDELIVPVSGPRIEARELAAALPGWRPSAPDADLAPSPLPGTPRRISRALLESWTLAAGADSAALPASLVVERKLDPLTPESAAAVIRSAIAAETGLTLQVIEVDIAPDQTLPAPPAGKIEWSLIGRAPNADKETDLRLRWQDAGGRTGVEVMRARVRAQGQWLAAVRDLPPRERISASDFRLKNGDMPSFQDRYPISIQQFGTVELKQSLSAGQALVENLLRPAPDVSRGDRLDLEIRAGAVVLRVPAQAEADARIGEMAPLKNLETDRRIIGRILTHTTAEAELP